MIKGVIAGNFDVIHPGYIEMFTQMKNTCDIVIVLLQDDPTIERPEKAKPILTVKERADHLLSLRQVDSVVKYTTEAQLYQLLKAIKPDIRFLGDDYKNKKVTGDDLPIKIEYIDRSHGWSATKYKKLIAQSVA